MLKSLTLWITTKCGKFLKRWEYQTTLPASCEICMQVRKEQLEQTWNNRLVLNWERSTSRFIYMLQKNCSKQKNGLHYHKLWGFHGGSDSRKFACNARDLGLIPGLGRFPGEGNGTQHHFCSMHYVVMHNAAFCIKENIFITGDAYLQFKKLIFAYFEGTFVLLFLIP